MNKNIPFILLLILVFTSYRCFNKQDINNRILIVNKLDRNVYVIPSFAYPDTSLIFLSKKEILINGINIAANSEKRVKSSISLCYQREWEKFITLDTLIVFVFNRSDIDNLDWRYIQTNDLVKRYYLDYKTLKANNCQYILK